MSNEQKTKEQIRKEKQKKHNEELKKDFKKVYDEFKGLPHSSKMILTCIVGVCVGVWIGFEMG